MKQVNFALTVMRPGVIVEKERDLARGLSIREMDPPTAGFHVDVLAAEALLRGNSAKRPTVSRPLEESVEEHVPSCRFPRRAI
ncbi:MAG: hypothetical protein J7520_13950 [Dokdonella sp.]|nr:hypothetical protein [Dokdonella sp.]